MLAGSNSRLFHTDWLFCHANRGRGWSGAPGFDTDMLERSKSFTVG